MEAVTKYSHPNGLPDPLDSETIDYQKLPEEAFNELEHSLRRLKRIYEQNEEYDHRYDEYYVSNGSLQNLKPNEISVHDNQAQEYFPSNVSEMTFRRINKDTIEIERKDPSNKESTLTYQIVKRYRTSRDGRKTFDRITFSIAKGKGKYKQSYEYGRNDLEMQSEFMQEAKILVDYFSQIVRKNIANAKRKAERGPIDPATVAKNEAQDREKEYAFGEIMSDATVEKVISQAETESPEATISRLEAINQENQAELPFYTPPIDFDTAIVNLRNITNPNKRELEADKLLDQIRAAQNTAQAEELERI